MLKFDDRKNGLKKIKDTHVRPLSRKEIIMTQATGTPWNSSIFIWALLTLLAHPVLAQETDVTQTPNEVNSGMKKSLVQQVGAGRGENNTIPDSSLYLIQRDPFRSIARGRNLFQRKFTMSQGFGPRTLDGDGTGDVSINNELSLGAGLVDSCAGCHGRPRGSAGFGGNVFTRPDSRDAPHLFGLGLVEMLGDEITTDLRRIRDRAMERTVANGQRTTLVLESKGITFGKITAMPPDGLVDTSEVEGVDSDLRVRPFFHHGGTISIREFVVGALNAEMGLEAYDPDLDQAANKKARIVTPSGMVLDGDMDRIEGPPVSSDWEDSDRDGVVDEVPVSVIDHLEFYLLNYFKPGTYGPASSRRTRRDRDGSPSIKRGQRLMQTLQCTTCHVPDLTIEKDRRVADVETVYDTRGVFNNLFATATPLFDSQIDNPTLPSLKLPQGKPFVVKNFYADLKRHDLGPNFYEIQFDGTVTKEFLTEPLWGVGSTPPYGHDGRSINLREVILRHGGEAQESRDRFARLDSTKQAQVLEFLESLVLFGPPDTASNLDPGNPEDPAYPQSGHGSIKLSVLFNDPTDPE